MGDFDLLTRAQLDALRALVAAGETIDACELVALRLPAPAGTRWLAYAQFDAMPNFRPEIQALGIVVEASKTTGYFLDLELRSEIDEDTVPVELLDAGGEATALFQRHGAGHQVEVYMFFPQVGALVSLWWGNLRPPREGGGPVLRCSAASGFRNAQIPLPHRVLFAGCGAPAHGSLYATQAEITASKGCDWNLNVGGGRGVPGSELLPPCRQTSRDECRLYLGDDLSFVGTDAVAEAIVVNQTQGSALLAYSKGNETDLKEPVRVVFGERKLRELKVSQYTRQVNTNHPDKGFVRVLMPGCEGPIRSMRECAVNDRLVGAEHLQVRLGTQRQPPTGFAPGVSNMNWTAHFFGVWGQVDPAQYNASNLKGSCRVEGLADVRVYSDPVTYQETYTRLRAWCLMEMLRNQRWGRGYKDERFVVKDWIDLAAFDERAFTYKLADGTQHTLNGTTYNAELVGRASAEQIKDVCLFGSYGLPFRHNGKVRIVPLTKEDVDDPAIPVFTDEGPDANIVIGKDGSQLFWSQIDLAELPNELVLTFEDAARDNTERPLTFKDAKAQKRAAASLGDTGIHVVPKRLSASGVGGITTEGEAVRMGWQILDLGEFEGGGIWNNLSWWFLTDIFEALPLRRYQLIKLVSSKNAGFEDPLGRPFTFFRVMHRRRLSDLYARVEVQAYNHHYYAERVDAPEPPVLPAPVILPNPGGVPGERPEPIGLEIIGHGLDRLEFKLQPSLLGV